MIVVYQRIGFVQDDRDAHGLLADRAIVLQGLEAKAFRELDPGRVVGVSQLVPLRDVASSDPVKQKKNVF